MTWWILVKGYYAEELGNTLISIGLKVFFSEPTQPKSMGISRL